MNKLNPALANKTRTAEKHKIIIDIDIRGGVKG